jgi:leucine dehydrogenase
LTRFLYQEGVKQVIGADTNTKRISHFEEEFKGKALWPFRERALIVNPEEIYDQQCDIFAPCAIGGVLNSHTIPRLNARIIAGSANNQLADSQSAKLLAERSNILYAPDYVINAGGLINVDEELQPGGYDERRVQKKLENIFYNLLKIFWYSERLNLPTSEVADILAEEKIYLKEILK